MNRFDEAVEDLLATAPAHPGLDALRNRARRRRQRHAVAVVAIVGVISLASVGVAASLGRDSTSPHIAVSPTSSTTTTVDQRCPGVDELRHQEVLLEEQANRLFGVLQTAIRANASDIGVLEAQHQAVLRELSDVVERRLRLDAGGACAAANDSAQTPTSVDCEDDGARDAAYAALDAQRVTLRDQERSVSGQLEAALTAHSPDVGVLDAKHQAILRRIAEVEQQILAVETGPRVKPPCTP